MITAKRISSFLTLDWSQLSRFCFIDTNDTSLFSSHWESLKTRFTSGEVGFYDTPINENLSNAVQAQDLAKKLLHSCSFTDCLFLGIGGSVLGPMSLLHAFPPLPSRPKTLRFHFMDNPDPWVWKSTLSTLDPESTLVCAVSKSGTTFETLAQALLSLEWLQKERWKTHFVTITEPGPGDLYLLSQEKGFHTLPISPSIGGRFSLFSSVGLFPAALAGLSVSELLEGAKEVRNYIEKTPPEKNALFILAAHLVHLLPQYSIHVCMPYASPLRFFSEWFTQLWAESLGKNGQGFTPIKALGSIDQHSILQLLRDGPRDKVTFFISVDMTEDPIQIPQSFQFHYPTLKALGGRSLHQLLQIEMMSVVKVLTQQERPSLMIRLDHLNESSLGALYYSFFVLTAFTGKLLGVNPFDQPGVEEGKNYIRKELQL